MKRSKRGRADNGDGRLLERLAISEACRDAWYAVALHRAEELMRDPELRDEIDDAIGRVLEKMLQRLRARPRHRR